MFDTYRETDNIAGVRPGSIINSTFIPAFTGAQEGACDAVASMGIPVFACTPDQFPDLMACALCRNDIENWAADSDIKLIREDEDRNTL